MKQDLPLSLEVARSVVVIAEAGNFKTAANRLGLSEPGLNSHIKQLQDHLGCKLFTRSANGALTEMGLFVVEYARQIIESNDKILRIGSRLNSRKQPVRLGLTNLYVEKLVGGLSPNLLTGVVIQGGNSAEMAKGLIEGHIDVGCFFASPAIIEQVSNLIVNETEEQFVWLRSKEFALDPCAPVPILTHPGNTSDSLMIRALMGHGIPYRIALTSADNQARSKAVEAGIGITAYPVRFDHRPLIPVRDYLPELPPLKVLLCSRRGFEEGADLLKSISNLLFTRPPPVLATA